MNGLDAKRLLIDTCGETAGVALSAGAEVVARHDLDGGRASVGVVAAIRDVLLQAGWMLADLAAIVVVNGPGSFTGMRTGLATAKGLCEASSLPLVTVSRLAVLAAGAAGLNTMAALDAGRGELYLREGAHEFLGCADDLESILQGRAVVVAEGRLYERLVVELGTDRVMLRPLHAADALQVVLLHPAQPSSVLAEANYVRLERDIYPRAAGR